MRRRRYFVGLIAAVAAVSTIMLAGPAGAAGGACTSSMNPFQDGNASGLIVSCSFTNAGLSNNIQITDSTTALWHAGATRSVAVKMAGTSAHSTAGKTTVKSAATTAQLNITAADINHNIEGLGITPGTFVKSMTGTTTVNLSSPTTATGPKCTSGASCTIASTTAGTSTLSVSNTTARSVKDGVTTLGGNTVTSTAANFKSPADVGMRLSGGDLPDGSTISSITGNVATLVCTGCTAGAFGGVSAAASVVISIEPATTPTTNRFVTDGTFTHTTTTAGTIGSASAAFAATDLGLPVVGTGIPVGARITAIGSATSATINKAVATGTAKKYTIGLATKNAPANLDVIGTLSITLQVNPVFSPTSPSCAAGVASAFEIPLQWRTPGSYDTVVSGLTKSSGSYFSPTSVAQIDFNTASTSFAGYLVQGAGGYHIDYGNLPVSGGVCPGTPETSTWDFGGISLHSVQSATNTGPVGAGGTRALLPTPFGVPTSITPVLVTTGAGAGNQPTNSTGCASLTAPPSISLGC